MTFRTRLLLVTSLTVAGAVALASGAISVWTRMTFERLDHERQQSVLNQFQRDLATHGAALAERVDSAAASPIALRAAVEAARDVPDESLLVNSAAELGRRRRARLRRPCAGRSDNRLVGPLARALRLPRRLARRATGAECRAAVPDAHSVAGGQYTRFGGGALDPRRREAVVRGRRAQTRPRVSGLAGYGARYARAVVERRGGRTRRRWSHRKCEPSPDTRGSSRADQGAGGWRGAVERRSRQHRSAACTAFMARRDADWRLHRRHSAARADSVAAFHSMDGFAGRLGRNCLRRV